MSATASSVSKPDRNLLDLLVSESPAAGSLTDITPDIKWLRLGLPFRLNHVNVWLLRDGEGWAIIDTGLGAQFTKDIWEQVFGEALQGAKPTCIICTHYHPDHMGCAGWLVEKYGVPFYAPLTEWAFGRMISLVPDDSYTQITRNFYSRFGLSGARFDEVVGYGSHYARNVTPLPTQINRLRQGDRLTIGGRDWLILTYGGHTPEHACLYNAADNIFIAGDQVLPFISPNISVSFYDMLADPLTDYFTSLRALKLLPPETLTLPSHGVPFRKLHLRVEQLEQHHAERLKAVEDFCTQERTVTEIMDMLFPQQLDPHQIMFAIGEAASHANHLVGLKKLVRTEGDIITYKKA